jgi:hypothetical protein
MRLSESIEALYRCFSRYRLRNVPYCGHCFHSSEERALHAPLRLLPAEALSPFMQSTFGLFGQLQDFKRYLPRILELLAHPAARRRFSAFDVCWKLRGAQWQFWPADERRAIEDFLRAWFRDRLGSLDACEALRQAQLGLGSVLDVWLDLPAEAPALNAAQAVLRYPGDWSCSSSLAAHLERAFFVSSDPASQRQLSRALDVVSGQLASSVA